MDLSQLYSGVGMGVVWLGITVFALTIFVCALLAMVWLIVAWRGLLRGREHTLHWRTICAWAGWSMNERYVRQHLLQDALTHAVDEYHRSLDDTAGVAGIVQQERVYAMERAMRRFAHALDQARAKHLQAHLPPPPDDPMRAKYINGQPTIGVDPYEQPER